MNTEKSHKHHSIQEKITYPVISLFGLFVVVIYALMTAIYTNRTTAQANQATKTMSQQIIANYDTYFESVIKVSDAIQAKIDYLDLSAQRAGVASYFDEIISIQSPIYNISIYSASGAYVVGDSSYTSYPLDSSKEVWFTRALDEPLVNNFSPVSGSTSEDARFTVSKHVYYNQEKLEGVMKIEYSFSKIVTLIARTDLGDGGNIYIYDKNGNYVYASVNPVPEPEKKLAQSLVFGQSSFSYASSNYLLYVSTIQNTTWSAAIATNNNSLTQAIRDYTVAVTISSVLAMLVFSLVILLISRHIREPLRSLQEEMAHVESLNYEVNAVQKRAETRGISKEAYELTNSFDQMMSRIKELNQANIKEEEEKRKSELKALQNQINPHFLYNTMDSIIYLIDKGDNQKAEEMIMALSKFFRISISRGQNIIPLTSELEHAKNYLIIQKMRYGDSFDYQINTQPGVEKYFVIKLILQPIVENAIIHGIQENSEVSAKITIDEKVEDGFIKLVVKDDGYGILPEKVQEIFASFKDDSAHSGVGLKNVYQRLKIYYGEKADIKIDSELDKGTTITILIPEEGALKDEE
jgi:two-component system sensor histidine kinase YesM